MRFPRKRIALLLSALLLSVALPIAAHTALRSSVPAHDAHVQEPPTELLLTFTTAVEPSLARVELLDADSSSQPLGTLRAGATSSDLVAPVVARLPAGAYTVRWQVLGSDGHPVRGRVAFTVDPPADTLPPVAPDTGAIPGTAAGDQPVPPDVGSPSYVAARWLTFAALVSLIGAAAFYWLVLTPSLRRDPSVQPVARDAAERAALLGRGAAFFLILASIVRLLLQTQVVGGIADTDALMQRLILGTSWGHGWLLQISGALVGLVGFQLALRRQVAGWILAAACTMEVAIGAAMSGHAAALDNLTFVAIAADSVHVLAASVWLGTLLVLMSAGLPAALRDERPGAGRLSSVALLVSTFSPRALVAAGITAATGTIGAILHLPNVAALWNSDYGVTLLLKLAAVFLVVGLGAYNWQRVRPGLEAGADTRHLRSSARLELLGAALVLLITSVLVALPTP
jgi:copper transport protein